MAGLSPTRLVAAIEMSGTARPLLPEASHSRYPQPYPRGRQKPRRRDPLTFHMIAGDPRVRFLAALGANSSAALGKDVRFEADRSRSAAATRTCRRLFVPGDRATPGLN